MYECSVHGECTSTPFDHRKACSQCDEYRPPLTWISTRRLAEVTTRELLPKLPPRLAGVVGIPRSGMIPASILATMLHLPLMTLDDEPRDVGRGVRARNYRLADHDAAPLLVVDDTVYAGHAMGRARKLIGDRPAVFAAVFVHPSAARSVDHFGRLLHPPHLLEWNLLNNGTLSGRAEYLPGGVALDFDGIVCTDGDPTRPLMIPRALPIPLVITGRAEHHRAATLDWCERWGVRIERLEMRPGDVGEDWPSIARWKAGVYRTAPQSLYVESDPQQARLIAAESKKPVVCPAAEEVYQ